MNNKQFLFNKNEYEVFEYDSKNDVWNGKGYFDKYSMNEMINLVIKRYNKRIINRIERNHFTNELEYIIYFKNGSKIMIQEHNKLNGA